MYVNIFLGIYQSHTLYSILDIGCRFYDLMVVGFADKNELSALKL